jgi:hypothetical protein
VAEEGEGEGVGEVEAGRVSWVVACNAGWMNVQLRAGMIATQGRYLRTTHSRIGHRFKAEINAVVVHKVNTHPLGKSRVEIACAHFTTRRGVATRAPVAPFYTSRGRAASGKWRISANAQVM